MKRKIRISRKTLEYERVKTHIALNIFQMARGIYTTVVIIALSVGLIVATTATGAQQHLVFASSSQITAAL